MIQLFQGVIETVRGSPFAQMSTFGELPVSQEAVHMENRVKGTEMVFEIVVAVVGIIVTIISIIVTSIGIIQTAKENKKHQKSNRPNQS